jgi:glutaminyl-peptide cyclotransferase
VKGFLQTVRSYTIEIILIAALVAAVGFFGYLGYGLLVSSSEDETFSGSQALLNVGRQMEFGPRTAGTENSEAMRAWLIEELGQLGWQVYIQPYELTVPGVQASNIIAVRGNGPTALLGTGYDTRIYADQDPNPERRTEPVPGANGGASGAAVLLELARTLDVESSGHEICLVFFDAESNGGIPGWEWRMGSRHFVSRLDALPRCSQPQFAVMVDLVGTMDQQIYQDPLGNPSLVAAIWGVAAELGYSQWIIGEPGEAWLADVQPFSEAGIPAVNLADLNYPHHHTLSDTLDKVSADSLQRIGRTLEIWLEAGAPHQNNPE